MSGDLKAYQAAKDRVERFRGGETMWLTWGTAERLRADLNTIAAYEAGQVGQAPQVAQIDARTLMMAHVMGGLLAHHGANAEFDLAHDGALITDAALSALKVNHD